MRQTASRCGTPPIVERAPAIAVRPSVRLSVAYSDSARFTLFHYCLSIGVRRAPVRLDSSTDRFRKSKLHFFRAAPAAAAAAAAAIVQVFFELPAVRGVTATIESLAMSERRVLLAAGPEQLYFSPGEYRVSTDSRPRATCVASAT